MLRLDGPELLSSALNWIQALSMRAPAGTSSGSKRSPTICGPRFSWVISRSPLPSFMLWSPRCSASSSLTEMRTSAVSAPGGGGGGGAADTVTVRSSVPVFSPS
jgi:hypothetical protein